MNNNFRENLRDLRIMKNLKQEELAKAINTTQRRISYFETGKIEPDLETLCLLSDYFEITIDELVKKT